MEPIVSLIYCSEVAGVLQEDGGAIGELLETARANNKHSGISGVLCFNREYVLQCVEGGRTAINMLYARLIADDRHTNVTLLDYRHIARRSFRDWSMGYIPANSVGKELNLMYSTTDDFNPFQFSGEGAYLFVQEVGGLATNAAQEK